MVISRGCHISNPLFMTPTPAEKLKLGQVIDGLSLEDKQKKKLKKTHKILDHMGSTELAANLFRTTQTEDKLRRDQVTGKLKANKTHYQVGQKVRKTILDLGGTMPEKLPTPESSIQQLENKKKKESKNKIETKA